MQNHTGFRHTDNSARRRSSRNRDQAAFSNLQSFLVHTSPCVAVNSQSCSQDLDSETTSAAASQADFRLADLWQSFGNWSAFGAEVPLCIPHDQQQVTQCYVPYLSALQLFEKELPIPRPSLATPPPPPPAAACFSDDDLQEPLSSNVSTASSSLSTDSDSEDGKLGPSPVRTMRGSVLRGLPSEPKKVLYEFFEHVGPHQRDPLTCRIEQLAADSCPGLTELSSSDLHPASWMSVAWYPIYSIPASGSRIADLGACFLTCHSLALPPRQPVSWQAGMQPNPPPVPTQQSAAAYEARQKLAESKLTTTTSSNSSSSCQQVSFLRPFGFMPYKMQGRCWQDHGHLHDLHHAMMAAAAGWAERRGIKHPDLDFFMSRSGFISKRR